MPYLMDGYNLYHAVCKQGGEWTHMIPTTLCGMIVEDMQRLRDKAVVVFDGRQPRGQSWAALEGDFLRVVYSGAGSEADAVLEKLIQDNTAPRRLTVVSSDRRVRQAARRRRAKSVSSAEYWQELIKRSELPPPKPREPQEKRRGLSEGELKEWLDLFDIDIDPDEPRDETDRIKF